MVGFQHWSSIYEAKRLLNLSNNNSTTTTIIPNYYNTTTNPFTKEEIELAFRNAAKLYHPDSTSINSQPCPIKFRKCLEARDLLLRELISSPSSSSQQQQHHYQNSNGTI